MWEEMSHMWLCRKIKMRKLFLEVLFARGWDKMAWKVKVEKKWNYMCKKISNNSNLLERDFSCGTFYLILGYVFSPFAFSAFLMFFDWSIAVSCLCINLTSGPVSSSWFSLFLPILCNPKGMGFYILMEGKVCLFFKAVSTILWHHVRDIMLFPMMIWPILCYTISSPFVFIVYTRGVGLCVCNASKSKWRILWRMVRMGKAFRLSYISIQAYFI